MNVIDECYFGVAPSLFDGFCNADKEQTLTMNKHLLAFAQEAYCLYSGSTFVSGNRKASVSSYGLISHPFGWKSISPSAARLSDRGYSIF